jgi:zinc D-Ala-D-Ala carboxypeptidase
MSSNISEHISFKEATFTNRNLPNVPNETQLKAMELVAVMCFEKIRKWYGKPIKINSFFRSLEVNKAVGGASTSQHTKGEAIDLTAGSREENKKIFEWAKANLTFDQLIFEYGDDSGPDWVHISYRSGKNRMQVLRIK